MTDPDDAKRKILERVADGSLAPSDAAEQLAALETDATAGPDEDPTGEPSGGDPGGPAGATPRSAPATAAGTPTGTVREVRIRGMFRPVEVIGDSSVHEAVAEGRHSARIEGDTLVIDGETLGFDDEDDDEDDWFRFARGIGTRRMGMRLRSAASLQVRMNPDLALDAKVDAGPLNIRDVHGPIRARVSAGPLKIQDFEGPLDLHVAAGPIKARGVLSHGDSRIQCEAGAVHLHLEEGSSVRVSAAATLGKVHLFGDRDHGPHRRRNRDFHWEDLAGPGVGKVVGDVIGKLGGNQEATIGGGEGTLDVEVSMGAVHISAD